MKIADLLKNCYLFKNLHEHELSAINEIAEEIHYPADDIIFKENTQADALYIIVSGVIGISQYLNNKNITVTELSEGDHFGEMAFIDCHPRSATAKATTDAVVIKVSYENLNGVLAQDLHIATKLYCSFSHFLVARLRKTTIDLTKEREFNNHQLI